MWGVVFIDNPIDIHRGARLHINRVVKEFAGDGPGIGQGRGRREGGRGVWGVVFTTTSGGRRRRTKRALEFLSRRGNKT